MTSAAASLAKDVISVAKLRIGVTIMMSAVGGVAVTPGPLPDLWRVALLGLAVFMASASAGAFNQWAKPISTGSMKRTARPFARGRFKANGIWLAAIFGLLAAAVVLAAWVSNLHAAFHTFMGAFVYGIVYTVAEAPQLDGHFVVGGVAGKSPARSGGRRRC